MLCPTEIRRIRFLVAVICCLSVSVAVAQQSPANPQVPLPTPLPPVEPQAGQQPAPLQAPPVQVPPGFQLNKLQQAFLAQVLAAWQRESGKIDTFSCDFERLDFNVFGPAPDKPLSIDSGELSYQRPDKGSFQIARIKKWDANKLDYIEKKDAVGEHWVCDGATVFEYRHHDKQLVERPIPVELQGKAIVDGPLPFLFGADAAKLQARYWMRVIHDNQTEIWLEALPKFQADAANFSLVRVILDRRQVLPKAMEVNLPDKSRHVYKFDLENASVNNPLARLGALFQRPRTPFGWKRVVEQVPLQQAAQPAPPPR
jgi:TIGR03009 family protein